MCRDISVRRQTDDFRAACVDVLLGICDGEAALGDFRMTCEAEEEEGVDMDMLQRLQGDSTRRLRSKVEAFIAEHARWPLSRGGTVEGVRAYRNGSGAQTALWGSETDA